MVAQPSLAYQSATRGLELWWTVVTPALLPFFFISELLMEMNISRYLSYAMSPLMRPLFNLPRMRSSGSGLRLLLRVSQRSIDHGFAAAKK